LLPVGSNPNIDFEPAFRQAGQCGIYGMGKTMLALKKDEIEGFKAVPKTFLNGRAKEIGWVNIK